MSDAKPVATPLVTDGNLTLHSVAQSTTEAEYRSVSSTTSEINWICSLLIEFGITLPTPPVIYCDNVGATYLCSNPVFHSRMKHVAINYHFIRDQVKSGALRVTHVSSTDQLVDALTKPLPQSRFQELRVKIGISSRAPS
ncbi:Retrovirus-related Pol polyprotein from transposon RE1 [Vitis vinifera]|uniref:Retrovirus-related Pol polyprotein from transposon RE1 n=1 Tax=Vitis vinifera TaxID=29760 RepID=A0A438FGB9_VITVI|nr:Retrovirus-related Pol polyprotein from transposon RE1 [Vitis vinifera]